MTGSVKLLPFQRVLGAAEFLCPPDGHQGSQDAADHHRCGHLDRRRLGNSRQRGIHHRDGSRDGYGVAGRGRHTPGRIPGTAADKAVAQADERAADEHRGEAQDDAGDAALDHIDQIDAGAQSKAALYKRERLSPDSGPPESPKAGEVRGAGKGPCSGKPFANGGET